MCDLEDQVTYPLEPLFSYLKNENNSQSLCQLIVGNVNGGNMSETLRSQPDTNETSPKRSCNHNPDIYLTRLRSHCSFSGTNHPASNSSGIYGALELSAVQSEHGTNTANKASLTEP